MMGIDALFPDWKALYVPGHTMHDTVFYNPADQILYIADLICDVKGVISSSSHSVQG